MSGLSLEDLQYKNKAQNQASIRSTLLLSSLAFVLGFSTIFIALGASATTIGRFLNEYRPILSTIAGIIIILMGCNFLGLFRIALFYREWRVQAKPTKATPLGAYMMGLAFACGWTPCIGPILGPILALAGGKKTLIEGISLLSIYCIGLGIPFLCAALFSNIFISFLSKFRAYLGKVEKIIGILLIITGILFLTGQMQFFSYWLLEHFPSLSELEDKLQ